MRYRRMYKPPGQVRIPNELRSYYGNNRSRPSTSFLHEHAALGGMRWLPRKVVGTLMREVIAMAKAFGVAGLVLNMIGAFGLWWIVPRGSTTGFGGLVAHPFRISAKIANAIGWPLLIAGFALQLVAAILAP